MIDLRCGDCLELMKDIPDGSVDFVLTDPPYGTTACKWDSVIPFEPMWEQLSRIIKPNGAICLFGSEPFSSALRVSNIKNYRYDWIWCKEKPSNFALAKKNPLKYHENISIFYNKFATYNPQMTVGKPNHSVGKGIRRKENESNFNSKIVTNKTDGMKYPKSVLFFNREPKPIHPTQKPVALIEYLVRTYTNEGETVLDFTMGSGSTGVACVNTGRNFIGIELDKGYFQIAKERIETANKKDSTF
jgi:site-specific DNA-methyltransferase (adenine-specific)